MNKILLIASFLLVLFLPRKWELVRTGNSNPFINSGKPIIGIEGTFYFKSSCEKKLEERKAMYGWFHWACEKRE